MMHRVRKKISSERGASITFALLLFLVCAIISSVLLVAGTSAAGRLSGMSTSEQRYYSASSSAKMIQDLLDGKTATVIQAGDETYYVLKNKLVNKVNGASKTAELSDFVAYQIHSGVTEDELELSSTNEDVKSAVDSVTVKEEISEPKEDSSGQDITFTTESTTTDKNGNVKAKYTIKLVFSTSARESDIKIDTADGSISGKETVYTWNLKEVKVY